MSGNFEMDLGTERVEVRRVEAASDFTLSVSGVGKNLNTIEEVMSDDAGYVVMKVKAYHRLDSHPEFKSKVTYALIRVDTDGSFDILTLNAVKEPWRVLMGGVNADETEVLRLYPDSFAIVDRYVGDVYDYMEDAKKYIDRLDPYESCAGDLLLVELYGLVLDRIEEQSRGFGG